MNADLIGYALLIGFLLWVDRSMHHVPRPRR